LRCISTTAVVLGLPKDKFITEVSDVLAAATSDKPPVIWLEGQDCAGCTISFAGSLYPPACSIILDTLSIRYHEVIMAASGDRSKEAYRATVGEGGYVLVVEGSIPTADDRFCMVGGRPFKEIMLEAAEHAALIMAVGACATFGGIPGAGPTGAVGVGEIVKEKPIINLSSCPVNSGHLVGTILYYLTTKKMPPLDDLGRPLMFYGENIHENCRRATHFECGEYLTDWNDPKQKNWCLINKGCKGPETNSDCPVNRWNDGLNFCIDCGAGCRGCAEPSFYSDVSPLYATDASRIEDMKKRIRLSSAQRQSKNQRKEV